MARQIPVSTVQSTITSAIQESAYRLPADYLAAMAEAHARETSDVGQIILHTLRENFDYAEAEQIPTCQDTGMAVIHMAVGQQVHFVDGDLNQAIGVGVREAYVNLRKSVINDPLLRENTGDNTPPVVHYEIVSGNEVAITIMMKGFGAELMSRLQMFAPSVGIDGVKGFVLETIELAGPNACPPLIVGVGLGGSFDSVGWLAKKALMRRLGESNSAPHLAALEADLLAAINETGIGPQGFGGITTALGVHVESYPTHIAALPVAVNLNCSAPRRVSVTL